MGAVQTLCPAAGSPRRAARRFAGVCPCTGPVWHPGARGAPGSATAPQQPKTPCVLARAVSSGFSRYLAHGARALCPLHEEEEKHSLPSGKGSPSHPAAAIFHAGTWTLTMLASQLSYFKHGLGLIKCSLISTWKRWRNTKPAHLYW